MRTYFIRDIKGRSIKITLEKGIFGVYSNDNHDIFIKLSKVVSFLRYHGVMKETINELLFAIKEEFINNKDPEVKEALDAIEF
ncbi:MAG: hypothetical protein J7L03_06645 [Caldisericaceae bacterium]|nr:hypothetical protein [Caldisericaceae bacterium]